MEMLHTDRRGSYFEMEAEALDRLRSMGVTGSKMDAFSKPDMFNRAAEPAATPCAMKTLLNIVAEAKLDFAVPEAAPAKPASPFSKGPSSSCAPSSPAPASLSYTVTFEFANPFLQSAMETVKDLCSKSKSACLTFVRQSGVAPLVRLLKAVNQDTATLQNALETLNYVLQKTLFSGAECIYEGTKALEDLATCEALPCVLGLLKAGPSQAVCDEVFRLIEVMSCKDHDSFVALKHAGGVELMLRLAFPQSGVAASPATQQQAQEMLVRLARAETSVRRPRLLKVNDSALGHHTSLGLQSRRSSNWADHQAVMQLSRSMSMAIPEKGVLVESKAELEHEQLVEYAINTIGKQPVHWAAQLGELVFLNTLLEAGAAPEPADIFGNTPLHLAAMNSHLAVVKALLAIGCDSSRVNIEGKATQGLAKPDSDCYHHLVSDQYVNSLLRTPRPCLLSGAQPEPSTSTVVAFTVSFSLHTGVVALHRTATTTPARPPSRAFACISPPPLEPVVTTSQLFYGVPYKATIAADRVAGNVVLEMPAPKALPDGPTTSVIITTTDPEGLASALKRLHKNAYLDANKAAAKVVEYKKLWQEHGKAVAGMQEKLGKAFVEMLAVKDRVELEAIRSGQEGSAGTHLGERAREVFRMLDRSEEEFAATEAKLADAKAAMLNIIDGLVAANERQLAQITQACSPEAEARASVVKERIACLTEIAVRARKMAKEYPAKHKAKVNFQAERLRLASMLGVDMQHGPVVSSGLATVDQSIAMQLTGEKAPIAHVGKEAMLGGGSSSRKLPPTGRKPKASSTSKGKKSSSVEKSKKKAHFKENPVVSTTCVLQADEGLDIDMSAMLSGLPTRARVM